MKIIMLGAPGSGKGTQSKLIGDYYLIPHLSTGEIFRDNIKRKTELGVLSKEYIDKGFLVPDNVTISMLSETFARCGEGFILDGFPRTLNQAFALNQMCRADVVINLVISDVLAINRLSGRWSCGCGEIYHENALVSLSCKNCGGQLYQRSDDAREAIINRLAVYHSQTEPLIQYYEGLNILLPVNADNDVRTVFEQIKQSIEEITGQH